MLVHPIHWLSGLRPIATTTSSATAGSDKRDSMVLRRRGRKLISLGKRCGVGHQTRQLSVRYFKCMTSIGSSNVLGSRNARYLPRERLRGKSNRDHHDPIRVSSQSLFCNSFSHANKGCC